MKAIDRVLGDPFFVRSQAGHLKVTCLPHTSGSDSRPKSSDPKKGNSFIQHAPPSKRGDRRCPNQDMAHPAGPLHKMEDFFLITRNLEIQKEGKIFPLAKIQRLGEGQNPFLLKTRRKPASHIQLFEEVPSFSSDRPLLLAVRRSVGS